MVKCYTSPTGLQWFWPRKSCKFFPWYQIFIINWILHSNVYIFEYEHLKRFVWKDDDIRIEEDWESGTFSELTVMGAICRCAMAKKTNPSTYIFFVILKLLQCKIYYLTAEISWLSPLRTECWSTLTHVVSCYVLIAGCWYEGKFKGKQSLNSKHKELRLTI